MTERQFHEPDEFPTGLACPLCKHPILIGQEYVTVPLPVQGTEIPAGLQELADALPGPDVSVLICAKCREVLP